MYCTSDIADDHTLHAVVSAKKLMSDDAWVHTLIGALIKTVAFDFGG